MEDKLVRQWTKLLGTSSVDRADSVSSVSDGSVYIASRTTRNINGGGGPYTHDFLITKYDSNGLKKWTQLLGSGLSYYGLSVSATADGSVYVAGNSDIDLDGNDEAFLSKSL